MKTLVKWFQEISIKGHLKKRERDANHIITGYREKAAPCFRNKEASFLKLIQSVCLSSRMVITRDRFTFIRNEVAEACGRAGISTEDLPLAIFYQDGKGDHPFYLQTNIIIKFLGLVQSREAVPILLNVLKFDILDEELGKMFGLDRHLLYYPAAEHTDDIVWALGQIGDGTAIPAIRETIEAIKRKYRNTDPELLIPLCKLGCHEEIEQLLSVLRTKPTSSLLRALIESRLYIPELLSQIKWIAENSQDAIVVDNAKQILREAGCGE